MSALSALRVCGLILLALTAATCQPDRSFLVVTVSGLSPQVQALEVRAVLADANQDAVERFEGIAGPSATVSMWLPPGAAGKLIVTATELASSCSVGEGTTSSALTGQLKLDLEVALQLASPVECEVTIEPSGDGTGLVTVEPPAAGAPLSCGDRCTFRAPVGSTVTLHAQVKAPSYLSRWSGPCTTVSPGGMLCRLQVASGSNRVGVEFIGRSCTPGVFCGESPIAKAPAHKISYTSVWGASSQDLWVVDTYGIILHRLNGWWSEEVPISTEITVGEVHGTSNTDVWVVANDYSTTKGMGMHWNGQAWNTMDLPTDAQIATMWGLSPTQYFVAPRDGYMLSWDGASWRRGVSNQPKVDIAGIWGTGGVNIWLVGTGLYQYNGSNNWIRDTAIDIANFRPSIWGVSPNDYWIVGEGNRSYHRVNGALKSAALPEEVNNRYQRIFGTTSSDVWAVSSAGSIVHFDGAAWSLVEKVPTIGLTGLAGLWLNSTDVYAVGDDGVLQHLTRPAP